MKTMLEQVLHWAAMARLTQHQETVLHVDRLTAIARELDALERRAEAAERMAGEWKNDAVKAHGALTLAQAKLAELEKQEPVATIMASELAVLKTGMYAVCDSTVHNRPDVKLYTRPAPAINLAELLPDEMTSEKAAQLFFGKAITAVDVWNACLAAILRNIDEKSKCK